MLHSTKTGEFNTYSVHLTLYLQSLSLTHTAGGSYPSEIREKERKSREEKKERERKEETVKEKERE